MKLNLYSISDQYIKYLRQFDDKIYDNKEEVRNRKAVEKSIAFGKYN